ncbi:MAG: PIN domain-containing protein [Deltaproteobacteria bacterium]|nr:PIN domain-containing protein [Deltaproteobacteria bacterium]
MSSRERRRILISATDRLVAIIAVYDACVLYPAPLRDLLVRLAMTGLFQAKWTDRILDECFRSILRDRPELTAQQLDRTRSLMIAAVRDCLVEEYEALNDGLHLPDPDDRHVLAAAIKSGAQIVVTSNLRDFPPEVLAAHGIEAISPDSFVERILDLDWRSVCSAVELQQDSLTRPKVTTTQLLAKLETQGLVRSVRRIRDLRIKEGFEDD